MKRIYSTLIKGSYKNSAASIILTGEILNVFPSKIGGGTIYCMIAFT